MSFAPQHDWQYYDDAVRPYDCEHARSLTVDQKFDLYKDLHRLLFRQDLASRPAEERRWLEKVLLRKRMLQAFGQ
jgi:hypothetical protein